MKTCAWGLMMFALAASTAIAEETPMISDAVRNQIQKAAAAQLGWKPEDVNVHELESIQLEPCAFFTVTHASQPVTYPPSYARLPDGQVVSPSETEESIRRILDACAAKKGASAASWAEVFMRFHPGVGPGWVLHDRLLAEPAIQRLEAAGKSFTPPTVVADHDGTTVEFYATSGPGRGLFHVTAGRAKDGTLSVHRTQAP